MQSGLKSISKIFTESIFRIPDYQRGYSWSSKQLIDFWNDIEQLPIKNNHYTGVITLEDVKEEDYKKWNEDLWIIESKNFTPYYIVDGQQRLTTTLILIQSIIEATASEEALNYTSKEDIIKKFIFESKDKGISKSYIFGYEKENPSYLYLKEEILSPEKTKSIKYDETLYTENLKNAKEFFKDKIKNLAHQEIEIIFTKISQHLLFNTFHIEKDLDVFVTFETMNNRGKPLSHLELLKNRLIYLSTKLEADSLDLKLLRKKINESWSHIYHYIGKIKYKNRTQDDLFLKLHFIKYFGAEISKKFKENEYNEVHNYYSLIRSNDGYENFLLEEIFNQRRKNTLFGNNLNISYINNYVEDIKKSVQNFHGLLNTEESSWPDDIKIKFNQIKLIGSKESFLYTLTLIERLDDEKSLHSYLTVLEKFEFLRKFGGYWFHENGVDLIHDSIDISSNKKTPKESIEKISKACEKYIQSKDFTTSIKSLGKKGHYYWNNVRYFMYEYEQYLRKKSKTSRQLLDWKNYINESYEFDHRSIEHILPQTINDKEWKEVFSEFSIQERNILKNSIGNLLPVSQPKNSSLSNKSFTKKKGDKENQIGYHYGCLSEIQVAMEDKWDAESILTRGIVFLNFMEERWGINFGGVSKKIDILNLRFLIEKLNIDINSLNNKKLKTPRITVEE